MRTRPLSLLSSNRAIPFFEKVDSKYITDNITKARRRICREGVEGASRRKMDDSAQAGAKNERTIQGSIVSVSERFF